MVDPTQTLARVQPALRSCGITRVAVLTGLDVIGIPVVAAYRPNSRSIAVHQGKGSTLAAAKASAVMEAIETAHAETTSLDLRLAAPAELAATAELADPAALPRAHGRVAGHARLLWVAGRDLFSGRPLWVPHELVSADFCVPLAPGAGLFQATTNGLASGNHPDEAIVHALTEVIERDAIALWRAASDVAQDRRALDPGSVDGPAAQAMLARFAAAGVAVQIWDITSDIGLPVFLCLCSSRALGDGVEPEFGAGCHTDRDVALARALAEAAQARLTVISGAREDVGADGFPPGGPRPARARCGGIPARAGAARFCAGADLVDPLGDGGCRGDPRPAGGRGHPPGRACRPDPRRMGHPGRTSGGAWPGRAVDTGGRRIHARRPGARGWGMTALVFLGPTLPAAEAMARLPCTLLPPAGQGDVFRAVRELRPRAIGLIDGVFLSARPVWHREILWALDQGVAVFGAASMGALRAAELLPFGMRGVGRVFEAFRDGRWPGEETPFEDDDEVAVVHAPAELGAGALSDAMVDLRDTLAAAAAAGVIDGDARLRLTGAMKALHFPDRSFLRLAEMARQVLPAGPAKAFSDFLADGIVPRKRLDACALLDAMAAFLAGPPAEPPDFVFQQAQVWERFCREEQARGAPLDAAAVAVLDELRLDPAAWLAASLAVCDRSGDDATAAVLHDRLDRFRRARGLWHRADLDGWMAANAVDPPGLARLLRLEAAEARRRCHPRCCRRCSIISASPAALPRCWTGPGASRRG